MKNTLRRGFCSEVWKKWIDNTYTRIIIIIIIIMIIIIIIITNILESSGTIIIADLLKKFHFSTKLLTMSSTETVFQIVIIKGGLPAEKL